MEGLSLVVRSLCDALFAQRVLTRQQVRVGVHVRAVRTLDEHLQLLTRR